MLTKASQVASEGIMLLQRQGNCFWTAFANWKTQFATVRRIIGSDAHVGFFSEIRLRLQATQMRREQSQ